MYYYPEDPKFPCSLKDAMAPGATCVALGIFNGLHLIDGQRAHGVAPFRGERYSVVWYTQSNFECPTNDQVTALQAAGFRLPSWSCLYRLTSCLGTEQFKQWKLAKPTNDGLLFSAETQGYPSRNEERCEICQERAAELFHSTPLRQGSRARLKGLENRIEFNGRKVTIVDQDEMTKRWRCELQSGKI